MHSWQTSPAKRVQAALNSHVLCQTSGLFQEQAQLFQVLWLKVALCESEKMQKRIVLVPYKQFRLSDAEISGISAEKEGWHRNLKCIAWLPKKIVATPQKHLLRCSDTACVYAHMCDMDCRDTYRFLHEEWSVAKQWEKGMWDSLWHEKTLLRMWIEGNLSSIIAKYHCSRSWRVQEVLSALSLEKGHHLCQRNHQKESVPLPQNLSWVISACQLDD